MVRTVSLMCLISGVAAYYWFVYQSAESPAVPSAVTNSLNSSGESVAVPGTQTQFLSIAQPRIADREINLRLTGTALRTKFTVKAYAIASFIEDGAKVNSAAELAAAEHIKLLHLVMERKATGNDFIDAFRTAVGKERAKTTFAAEFAKLSEALGNATADKGDSILMYYVPGTGTRICVGDSADVTIAGQAFGRAIWETYLGPKPISEEIRSGLVSRLGN